MIIWIFFFQLPLDFDKLSAEEQLKVLAKRKPKEKKKSFDDLLDGDTFSADNYLNNFKSWLRPMRKNVA